MPNETEVGFNDKETGSPATATITIVTPPENLESTVVAVTMTVGGSGMLAGAVYFPVVSIVPQLAPEQPVPETLQTTLWLAGGLPTGAYTFALNCCTAPI